MIRCLSKAFASTEDLRAVLEMLDPGALDTLRRVLMHDQGGQPPGPHRPLLVPG
jgi:hypothetical protein